MSPLELAKVAIKRQHFSAWFDQGSFEHWWFYYPYVSRECIIFSSHSMYINITAKMMRPLVDLIDLLIDRELIINNFGDLIIHLEKSFTGVLIPLEYNMKHNED